MALHNASLLSKEVERIDKNGKQMTKTISYWVIDSARFMVSSLTNLFNNFAERIHKIICKYGLASAAIVYKLKIIKCKCLYQFDPARFLNAPGLIWQVAFKKFKVKVNLFNDIDMILMVEQGSRGVICHAIHQYAKANNRYI